MNLLKKIFQLYVFSNIHVALAVTCLVKITLIERDTIDNVSTLFVFFSTLVAYNLIRFFRYSDLPKWIRTWLKANKKLLFGLTITSGLIVLIITFKIQIEALIWLSPFALFTIFYALPLPFKKSTLRNLPGIKIFLISISFAGITVLFPLVQNDIPIDSEVWISFFQRFIFVILITIPFDIRDLKNDVATLKTLPQKYGVLKVKFFGLILGVLFFALEFLKEDLNARNLNLILIVGLVSVLFLIFAKEKQVRYYSSFWVEAIPIYWLSLIYILN